MGWIVKAALDELTGRLVCASAPCRGADEVVGVWLFSKVTEALLVTFSPPSEIPQLPSRMQPVWRPRVLHLRICFRPHQGLLHQGHHEIGWPLHRGSGNTMRPLSVGYTPTVNLGQLVMLDIGRTRMDLESTRRKRWCPEK